MGKLLWNTVSLVFLAALALINSGCTGLQSAVAPSTTTPGNSVGVRVHVAPTQATVGANGTVQFTARVSNARNMAVTWSVASGHGTISHSGIYTAPATGGEATIRATSVSDPRSSALAYVTVAAGATPQGTAPLPHSVTLSWQSSTATVSGHNIYRAQTSGGPYTRLNGGPDPDHRFVDPNVISGQRYYYVVTSVDFAGVESAYSKEVVAVIPL